jgi:hypothetical protein
MSNVSVSREAIQDAIRSQYLDAVNRGDGWHYVRVWPDGEVTRGMEPSECVPESEYYRRGKPHPITIWSIHGINAGPAEAVYDWEECTDEEAAFWVDQFEQPRDERDERHNLPRKLGTTMQEDLDWDGLLPEIERAIEEVGYEIGD